jgi:hypothetical protein
MITEKDNTIDFLNIFDGKYKKTLIFRIGVESGFFSEYNVMIYVIDHCIRNKINFGLYSKDSNFGYKDGWTDYFEPFCANVNDKIHSTINYRPKINNKITHLWQLKYFLLEKTFSLIYKKIKKFDFYTQDIWKYIDLSAEQIRINTNDKEIQKRYHKIVKFTWRYNLKTKTEINARIKNLNLPDKYISLHIRRGDKITGVNYVSIEQYFLHIAKIDCKNIFVATDDYSIIEKIATDYSEYNIYTLCNLTKRGYQQNEYQKMDVSAKREHVLELLSTIEIINDSFQFIGTQTSNIGIFMLMRNSDICNMVD